MLTQALYRRPGTGCGNPVLRVTQPTGLLFRYRAGLDSVAALRGTFTRASTATYLDAAGVVQTAGAGVLRDAHYLGGVRHTLLEGARSNALLASSTIDTASAPWTSPGDFTITPAASCIAGQTAYQHRNLGTLGSRARTQIVGTFTTQADCLWMIAENVDAASTTIGIRDTTAGAFVAQLVFTWATNSTGISGYASDVVGGALALPNNRWLLWVSGTGTAGNTRGAWLYPTSTSTNTQAVVLHHAQLEPGAAAPGSVIVTTAAPVARAADAIALPSMGAGTLYERWADPITGTITETATAFGGGVYTPPVGRAYKAIVIARGTRPLAEMRAMAQ